jgi:hypothetical protein
MKFYGEKMDGYAQKMDGYVQSSLPAKCLYILCNATTCFGLTFGHLQGATSLMDVLSL